MEMTQKQLAELAGITLTRLLQINQGLPEDGKLFVQGKGGDYVASTFVQRYTAYREREAAEGARPKVTQQALADLTGKTLRTVQMINQNMPDGGKLFVKGEDGRLDAALFVQRWVAYRVGEEKEEEGKLDLDQVKAQHELKKMEKTELNLAIQRGKLVDTDDVRALWGDIITTARNKLLYIPASIAQRLVMLEDPVEIKEMLDKEIRTALEQTATCPLPQAAAPEEESEDTEE